MNTPSCMLSNTVCASRVRCSAASRRWLAFCSSRARGDSLVQRGIHFSQGFFRALSAHEVAADEELRADDDRGCECAADCNCDERERAAANRSFVSAVEQALLNPHHFMDGATFAAEVLRVWAARYR